MPARFPDVQKVLVAALATLAGGSSHVGAETPVDFAGLLPFIRVRRGGGGSDPVNDMAVVDVDVFADRYTVGEPLAEQVREFLTSGRLVSPRLDRVVCDQGPRELPWGDGTVRRWGATYEVMTRRSAVA